MEELVTYKKTITRLTVILIAIDILAITLLLVAAPNFGKSYISSILLVVMLVQILFSARIGMAGLKATASFLKAEEEHAAVIQINDDTYDQEVDKKINETTDNSFNINNVIGKIEKTNDWKKFGDSLLYNISKQVDIAVGIVFKFNAEEFSPAATFAYYNDEPPHSFKVGEGISGQVAKDKKAMFLNDLPSKSLMIVSGLGQIEVNNLAIIPILKGDNAVGLIEIATFKPFEKGFVNKIDEFSNAIGEISPN